MCGSSLVHLVRIGCDDHRVLDEMAGEAQVAFLGELPSAGEDLLDAARERHPLPGLIGARRGQQVVGLAVVPAAVATPHVADEELRVVVDRTQVGLVAEVGGHLDLVDHSVERAALVHQRERLRLE